MSDTLPSRALYALIAALMMALLPHLLTLPPWLALLIIAVPVWRASLVYRGKALPSRWLRYALMLALLALVFWQFRTLIGRSGGVAMLVSLIAIKLLETHGRRDAAVLTLLGYFASGAMFLVSQSFWMLLWALATAVALTTQLMAWQRRSDRFERDEAWRALRMLAEATPVILLLFLLFPRLSGPLWSMPEDRGGASSGLSDVMSPGSFTNLALDDSPAFRVSFDGEAPPVSTMYWRGPVFERFDGRNWQQLHDDTGVRPTAIAVGPTVRYSMLMEPNERSWLLALDLPVRWPERTRLTSRFQLVADAPLTQRRRVDIVSSPGWHAREPDAVLRRNLDLPASGNPKARALARQWQTLSAPARVDAAQQWLRAGRFSYSLTPPLLPGPDPVDDLLFTTREGFCEHYAGAFVFLMRAAGVPARVVGGYLGGERNAGGDYWLVRQADAHAWTEVWLDDRGWQRVDPTAAIAPNRINQGLAQSVTDAARLPGVLRNEAPWLKGLRQHWDATVFQWNRWVIGYDAQRQMQLLNRLGIDALASMAFIGWFAALVLTLLAGYAVMQRWRSRPPPRDAAMRSWLRFIAKLDRAGIAAYPGETPTALIQRATGALPGHRDALDAIARCYLAARYGEDHAALDELRTRVRTLRLSRAP
ncbi:transglutaminase TgpA family protein [Jeongeupia naejangsanensis]|uniref:DUF3488 domain-containing transglutaminase family protein n=1 Tax=Jeongeupia naejangsanensis TaxID=613195 RepID=A0ABS2BKD7_9NEIS|nr:DUF3488 and transglutaminase-like domain-containing protein [Jeongeupia naejangsanensis]MBM3115461.1 DUF3488 domain-containing transglutaminase family protein [Jeongeupia naejangsanensis]